MRQSEDELSQVAAGGEMNLPGRGYGVFCFGAFRLDPVSRTLEHDGVRLHLAARLFDTLVYLVQHHDRLVEREELSRAIWSSHAVSEGNLGRAISSLRLALKNVGEDGLIVTAPGRGYRFGKPVYTEVIDRQLVSPPRPVAPAPQAEAPGDWYKGRRAIIVAASLAAMAAGAFALLLRAPSPGRADATGFSPPPASIAVLPFVRHGESPGDSLYSEGIAQEVINALGRIGNLKVAASTSSFLFRDKNVPIRDIARQLNVGTVLEGSVQRAGSHIHVTVELIDARNGFQIWSHVYDQSQDDVLAMQGEIAAAAVTALKGVILGNEAARLTLGGTAKPAAFDAYLKGTAELKAMDASANRRATAFFNQATELDPNYALAFAARAQALAFIAAFGDSPDVDYSHRIMQAAMEDARRAVTLAPELGTAHASLAFVLQTSLTDLQGADAEYRSAIALAPGDAATLLNYGRFQVEIGHAPDGLALAEKAAALDPLSPKTYGRLTAILIYAGRYGDARIALRRVKVLQPDNTQFDRITLGLIDTLQGDFVAAQKICAGNVDYRDMMCLAIAYNKLGRQPEAEMEWAKAKSVLGDNGAYLYARIFAQWGQPAAALQWLQTAYRLRDPGLIELKADPALNPIRATPQYKALVRALGFPPG
jgi:TolB-like protein/DNA-binding winged helix-turn-helix (wHTH) protein/Tfp pilus assembly protein PilF